MKHLSSEQISTVVAGFHVSEAAHIRECAACALEVEHAQNLLALFRSSVREWTDRLDHSEFPVHEAVASRTRETLAPGRAPMVWVLAAAVLAVAVAIPVYQDSREREVKAQALRDDQLLDDVNAQLSRSGPLAMDPLLRLMSLPGGRPGADSVKSYGVVWNGKQDE